MGWLDELFNYRKKLIGVTEICISLLTGCASAITLGISGIAMLWC